MTPDALASEVQTDFVLEGRGSEPIGGGALVVFVAVAGTPFEGGTAASLAVPAEITSTTQVEGSLSACGVTGDVPVRVRVVLEDDREAVSDAALAILSGPEVTSIEPNPLRVTQPAFTLHGVGLGDGGGSATARFTATSGTPFLGGTSAVLEVGVVLQDPTRATGTLPPDFTNVEVSATVTYTCASGAEAVMPGEVLLRPRFGLPVPDPSAGADFGRRTAISGDTIAVSAPEDDEGGLDAGAVYVYVRGAGTWILEQKIVPTDAVPDHEFGWSLALDGDTLVVGARYDSDAAWQAGAVYVYTRAAGVWSPQAKLTAADAASGDEARLHGLGLGEHARGDGRSARRARRRLRRCVRLRAQRRHVARPARLTASDGRAGQRFGGGVSLYGNTVAVSSAADERTHGEQAGAVYVFDRSAGVWTESQTIYAPSADAWDWFGDAVSLRGDRLAVGAPGDDTRASDAGALYVFLRTSGTWSLDAELYPSDPEEDHYFGHYAAQGPDLLVISAQGDDDAAPDSGSVYVFTANAGAWTQTIELHAPDAQAGDDFGVGVSVGDGTIVVGAPGRDEAYSDCGAAYVF